MSFALKWLALASCLIGAGAHVAAGEQESPVRKKTIVGKVCEGEHFSDSDWPETLYSVSLTIEKGAGIDRLAAVYADRHGQTFFTQTIDFESDAPKAFAFSNKASKQEGKLTVTTSELLMEFSENGKTKTARQARPPLFAVGPSINRLVEQHLSEIATGKSLAFQMVVVNRLQTFGLHVVREPMQLDEPLAQVKSGQWLRLRIEPESAVAKLFAPKVLSIVDAKTGQTLFVSGPLPSPDPSVGMLKRGTIRYESAR